MANAPIPVLLVPIHVDALFAREPRPVVAPAADFSRLPHVRAGEDVNSHVPWLGEAIASRPFQEEPFWLGEGIHLHWALPDALCRTVRPERAESSRALGFPRVPNRWLVTKRWKADGNAKVEQWVVESDYLHPVGAAPPPRAITYPSFPTDLRREPSEQPFRYLGRSVPRAAWSPSPGAGDAYLREPLTALGYGEPSFAAFYPNCHSVFGFHDRDVTYPFPEGLSYEVLGWYDDPAQDHLHRLLQRADAALTAEARLQGVLDELAWQAVGAPGGGGEAPLLVCQARLTFAPGATVASRARSVEVTFGNTTAEALSAYLASIAEEHGDGDKGEIEDQLDAALLASQLEHRSTDVGPKFVEARHARGFTSAPPAYLWAIRPASDDPAREGPLPAWPDASRLLDELNGLQRAYNRAADEIHARRRQLVADWHKYMLCAHPEGGSQGKYPDPDEVRRFLAEGDLPELERLLAGTGELLLPPAGQGRGVAVVASAGSRPGSLAKRVADKAAELREVLDSYVMPMLPLHPSGEPPPMLEIRPRFLLQRFVAPRYFQPTDPVVLLTGDAARSGDRYARGAGPAGGERPVGCTWAEIAARPSEALDALQEHLTTRDSWHTRAWSEPPWHPFLMEWEVTLRPFARSGVAGATHGRYDDDFVVRNFSLKKLDVDLSARSSSPALAREESYRGSSLLTPRGVEPYLEALKREMERGELAALRRRDDPDEEEGFPGGGIISGPSDPGEDKCQKRFSAAERKLRTLSAMAQALTGLNDALLMNRTVLQLPVDDPLGFRDERDLAARVRGAVGDWVHRSPEPNLGFLPLRAGELRLRRLRVVDTFGQTLDVDCGEVRCRSAKTLPLGTGAAVTLPPRVVQPARLHFRWQSAERPEKETHAHPDSTPVCGFIMANHADKSLFVYAGDGRALGYLEVEGARVHWRSAPGLEPPIVELDPGIAHPSLRRLVRFFLAGSGAYFNGFLADLEAAQELIEPEDPGAALLVGRPLALVRACLQLQLQGPPAVHQGWHQLVAEMARGRLGTNALSSVRFPIRLGDQHRLGDGLTVYFQEDARGGYDAYVIPNYDEEPDVDPSLRKCDFLYHSFGAPPLLVTMLVDPRGAVHATTGILPTKSIGIPPHHYEDALRRLEMSFLSAPLLVDRGSDEDELSIPLADEPGRSWAFVEKRGAAFRPPRKVRAAPLHVPLAAPVAVREGWLRLTRDPPPDLGPGGKVQ